MKKKYNSPQLYLVNDHGTSRIRILYPDGKSEVLWQHDKEENHPPGFSCFSVQFYDDYCENWHTLKYSIPKLTSHTRHKFKSLKEVEKAAKRYDRENGIKTIFIANL